MPKGYQHLTYDQRLQIQTLKARGDCGSEIARQLNVHPSTISRELTRNRGQRGYRHRQAHQKAVDRKRNASAVPRKMTPALLAVIDGKLSNQQWSPEQIAGWLKREQAVEISHETIYQRIWEDKRHGGTLYQHLRRRGRKYQKRVHGKTSRGRIIGRVGIEERPAVVEERSRFGDWEADTIVGLGHQTALVTLVERKSRYTVIAQVPSLKAEGVKNAIIQRLSLLQGQVFTITFDNGKEFAQHGAIAQALQAKTYFARPYHSWERGLNENTNGLIRQYFPKKTDFAKITPEEVAHVERLLNSRPRKCLGFNTPERAILCAA